MDNVKGEYIMANNGWIWGNTDPLRDFAAPGSNGIHTYIYLYTLMFLFVTYSNIMRMFARKQLMYLYNASGI